MSTPTVEQAMREMPPALAALPGADKRVADALRWVGSYDAEGWRLDPHVAAAMVAGAAAGMERSIAMGPGGAYGYGSARPADDQVRQLLDWTALQGKSQAVVAERLALVEPLLRRARFERRGEGARAAWISPPIRSAPDPSSEELTVHTEAKDGWRTYRLDRRWGRAGARNEYGSLTLRQPADAAPRLQFAARTPSGWIEVAHADPAAEKLVWVTSHGAPSPLAESHGDLIDALLAIATSPRGRELRDGTYAVRDGEVLHVIREREPTLVRRTNPWRDPRHRTQPVATPIPPRERYRGLPGGGGRTNDPAQDLADLARWSWTTERRGDVRTPHAFEYELAGLGRLDHRYVISRTACVEMQQRVRLVQAAGACWGLFFQKDRTARSIGEDGQPGPYRWTGGPVFATPEQAAYAALRHYQRFEAPAAQRRANPATPTWDEDALLLDIQRLARARGLAEVPSGEWIERQFGATLEEMRRAPKQPMYEVWAPRLVALVPPEDDLAVQIHRVARRHGFVVDAFAPWDGFVDFRPLKRPRASFGPVVHTRANPRRRLRTKR